MQWQSWTEFWSMGGRGFFVWGSYGLTLLLIIIELIQISLQRKNTLRQLLRWRRAIGKNSNEHSTPPEHTP